jgi:predicted nuclease of predicted toxin-antitoxin system
MKILLDTCVWGGVAQELRAAGHDVGRAGDWQEDPGDDEILERAHKEGRVLVTLDKDFGELAIVHERPHSWNLKEKPVKELIGGIRCGYHHTIRILEKEEKAKKAH